MAAPKRPPGSTVVKVQLLLSGGEPNRGLVYAEGRCCMVEQAVPSRVYDLLMTLPNRKAYFTALLVGGAWHINDLTADQDW